MSEFSNEIVGEIHPIRDLAEDRNEPFFYLDEKACDQKPYDPEHWAFRQAGTD